jgi:protein-S-isoprenylcysteine O-methyltransferase Ste14
MIARALGAVLAVAAHLTLAVTVWYLFPFLMGGAAADSGEAAPGWWWRDALLVLQFALPHSTMLYPPVRARLERYVPRPLYGCLFTLTTGVCLLVLIHGWRASPVTLWALDGWPKLAVNAAYVLSWAGMVYGLSLSGFGQQTGWTPFWRWFRGLPPARREFAVRGAFRVLRHPVYLSFLGQVWFTPIMTADRALLVGLLTAYVAVGSVLKDRRLTFYLGDVYRRYQARVPGYPLAWGPLGRVPLPAPPEYSERFDPSRDRQGAVHAGPLPDGSGSD